MSLILDGTNGETLPSWTTATRPASPVAGQQGFNTTIGAMESYNGSAWQQFTNGPAFSAYQSTLQSLTANTITKLQFQTKEFDTATAYDNITNYRFTPLVAGYYQVNGAFVCSSNRTYNNIYIYKTGVNYKDSQTGNGTTGEGASISALIYLNGSTDYVELYGLTGVTQNTSNSNTDTWFQAVMVRSA